MRVKRILTQVVASLLLSWSLPARPEDASAPPILESALRQIQALPAVRVVHVKEEVLPQNQPLVGSVQSEGDKTHQADLARSTYGYDGAGVRIGVLSDSVDDLAASQANGNIGFVTVLPGQAGTSASFHGEGTAILEVIHDLAPGAELFFASASPPQAQFTANITALASPPYSCDVIVDDVA